MKLFPVKIRGNYGLINALGEIVVPARYLYAFREGDEYGMVRERRGYAVFSHDGSPVGRYRFERMGPFCCGRARVESGGKFGYCDISGKMVVDAVYEMVQNFTPCGAVVKYNGKFGAIKPDGSILIPAIFDGLLPDSEGVWPARAGGLSGFIAAGGKWVIPPRYRFVQPFQSGMAAVNTDGKWKFIRKSGDAAFERDFDFADVYASGRCPVREADHLKMCYVDESGERVSGYFTACQRFSEGYGAAYVGGQLNPENAAVGGRWVFFDPGFGVLADGGFLGAEPFSGELAAVYTGSVNIDEAKIGYIDRRGAMVWTPQD